MQSGSEGGLAWIFNLKEIIVRVKRGIYTDGKRSTRRSHEGAIPFNVILEEPRLEGNLHSCISAQLNSLLAKPKSHLANAPGIVNSPVAFIRLDWLEASRRCQ